jgi:hypothetical protein
MTPDTSNYMILGFVVIFGVLGLHLASFVVRKRSLAADLQALQPAARKKAAPKKAQRKAKAKRKKR